MDPESLPFNTAVFYDIENLLGGYGLNQPWAMNLSLREILERIRKTGSVGRMAVQRAYANWSDPRLGIFRKEINELGIEPVQVFGFAWDAKRNAADIQLAIDAVDLAINRPAIQTFVVVSGDGGFASLAKKLHEYGKSVIGAAYQKSANQTFQAVCDQFLWLEEPAQENEPAKSAKPVSPGKKPAPLQKKSAEPRQSPSPTSPLPLAGANHGLLLNLAKLDGDITRAMVVQHAGKVLQTLAKIPQFQRQLDQEGIGITAINTHLRECIAYFTPDRWGFPRLIDFLRHTCAKTKFQIARLPSDNSKQILIRRNHSKELTNWEILPDLLEEDLHSEGYYRHLLYHREPMIRIENPESFQLLVQWLCETPRHETPLSELLRKASEQLDDAVSADSIKQGLFSLLHAGAFIRTPDGASLSDQSLTLDIEWSSPAAMQSGLYRVAEEKITRLLGECKRDILSAILQFAPPFSSIR